MEEIARRRPIDKTAARVVSAGPKGLETRKHITQTHSDVPLPTIPMPRGIPDRRGQKVGRLTVVALAVPTTGRTPQTGNNRLWVCRCVCGRYLTRRSKALNNPTNSQDCCDHCRQTLYLKRRSTFVALGYNPDQPATPPPQEQP